MCTQITLKNGAKEIGPDENLVIHPTFLSTNENTPLLQHEAVPYVGAGVGFRHQKKMLGSDQDG